MVGERLGLVFRVICGVLVFGMCGLTEAIG